MTVTRKIKMRRTEIHPVLGGECSIFRTTVSGDIWQFQMWLAKERKWLRKSLRTTIRRDAEALAKNQWKETSGRISLGQKIFSISAKELVERYCANLEARVQQGVNRKGTLLRNRSWLRTNYLAFVGANTKIQSIAPEQFENFLSWHRSTFPQSTLVYTKDNQAMISILYRWAVNQKLITLDMMPKFTQIKIPKSQGKRLGMAIDEYRKLTQVSKSWHKETQILSEQYERQQLHHLILTQGWYGLRTTETLGLQWRDVTINSDGNATINIREETTKRDKNRKILGRGDVFQRVKSYSRHRCDHDHVFSSYHSSTRWNPYKRWQELKNVVKQKYGDFNDNLSLYDLRHFWVSSRLRGGESVWAISRYVGNSSEMIARHYDNVTDEQVSRSILAKRLEFRDDEVVAVPVKTKGKKDE